MALQELTSRARRIEGLQPRHVDYDLQPIAGVDASRILKGEQSGYQPEGFHIGYDHEGNRISHRDIGIDPSANAVDTEVLAQSLADQRVLVATLTEAAYSGVLDPRDVVGGDTNFPRYAIVESLMRDGIKAEPRVVVTRGDGFAVQEGSSVGIRYIEVNGKCPEAQAWTSALLRRTTGEPHYGAIGHVVEQLSDQVGRRVGIVVWDNDTVKGNERPFIAEEMEMLRERGSIDAYTIGNLDEVEEDSSGIRVAGERVDWVYRYGGPDDLLYAHSEDPSLNGTPTIERHPEAYELTDQLGSLYGQNARISAGTYDMKVAGVMWKLMQEGHRGSPVVFPDAASAQVGYKSLFPMAYDGVIGTPGNVQAIRRVVTPSYNLQDYVASGIPSEAVVKYTGGSQGKDVIVGSGDFDGVQATLVTRFGFSEREVAGMSQSDAWDALSAHLLQSPNGWIVQPQIHPGNYDLIPRQEGVTSVPYDVDPWLVQVGDTTWSGPVVVRYRPMRQDSKNLRINVVQGGRFTAAKVA